MTFMMLLNSDDGLQPVKRNVQSCSMRLTTNATSIVMHFICEGLLRKRIIGDSLFRSSPVRLFYALLNDRLVVPL